jgi:hypothetical protein
MAGTHLTRRAALAVAVVLPTPAIASEYAPDAQLVRLASQLIEAEAEAERLFAPFYDQVRPIIQPATAARLQDLIALTRELRQAIALHRATTLPGCRAKAEALLTRVAPGGIAPVESDGDFLAWSLCRDLLGSTA